MLEHLLEAMPEAMSAVVRWNGIDERLARANTEVKQAGGKDPELRFVKILGTCRSRKLVV